MVGARAALQRVVAGTARDLVVAAEAEDDVVTRRPVETVIAFGPDRGERTLSEDQELNVVENDVHLAGRRLDHEDSRAAPSGNLVVGAISREDGAIDAGAALQPVDAGASRQAVVAGAARQAVVAGAAHQAVVAEATRQAVVAIAARQAVIVGATIEDVVTAAAIQAVTAVAALQDVVAAAARAARRRRPRRTAGRCRRRPLSPAKGGALVNVAARVSPAEKVIAVAAVQAVVVAARGRATPCSVGVADEDDRRRPPPTSVSAPPLPVRWWAGLAAGATGTRGVEEERVADEGVVAGAAVEIVVTARGKVDSSPCRGTSNAPGALDGRRR